MEPQDQRAKAESWVRKPLGSNSEDHGSVSQETVVMSLELEG